MPLNYVFKQIRGFSSVKLWKFAKIINIDILQYYTCVHCLLTLFAKLTAIKSKEKQQTLKMTKLHVSRAGEHDISKSTFRSYLILRISILQISAFHVT